MREPEQRPLPQAHDADVPVAPEDYEPPAVMELGKLEDLTQGNPPPSSSF